MKRSTPGTLLCLARLAAAPLMALALAGCDSARLTAPQARSELPLPLHLTYETAASPTGELSLVLTRAGLALAGGEASAAPRYRLRPLAESASPGATRKAAARPLGELAGDESYACALPPGTYLIVDSSGNVVGTLIVYPNCTTEIKPR
ncbi:MAG TPA: hypothetical protein VF771_16190 [Longimicrobiaceae bacterium]